jgi:hypothetical protein
MTRLRRSGTLGAPARDFKISKPMTNMPPRTSPDAAPFGTTLGQNLPKNPAKTVETQGKTLGFASNSSST